MKNILSAGKEVFDLVAPDQRKRGPVSFELADIRQRLLAAGAPYESLAAVRILEKNYITCRIYDGPLNQAAFVCPQHGVEMFVFMRANGCRGTGQRKKRANKFIYI